MDIHGREGITIVAVLHDLNVACRYTRHLVAMSKGAIVEQGLPAEIITLKVVAEVVDLYAVIIADPLTGTPLGLAVPRRRTEICAEV